MKPFYKTPSAVARWRIAEEGNRILAEAEFHTGAETAGRVIAGGLILSLPTLMQMFIESVCRHCDSPFTEPDQGCGTCLPIKGRVRNLLTLAMDVDHKPASESVNHPGGTT